MSQLFGGTSQLPIRGGNQIVEYSLDNGTALGSSLKLRGAAEQLIDDSEKSICRLSLESVCY